VIKLLKKRDYRNFEHAKTASMVSDFPRVHIGVVVVQKGAIISAGCNKKKTHPLQKRFNKYRYLETDTMDYVHAEMDALTKIRYMDLRNASVYIYRELHDGTNGMARPCNACMGMIKSLGIKHVYYTTDDGFAYERIV